jgi:glycosyltransferase involved in cell wall biosynthesis
MISFIILTKNEEKDLQNCLESISWSDDIHIVDSFSTDKTINIAKKFGVNVHYRKFDNYSSQRNFSLKLNFKYQWAFILDADETMTDSLKNEIFTFLEGSNFNYDACRIRRRDYFSGKWLKYSQISPFFIRMVKPQMVHFIREVNEVIVVKGEIFTFKNYFNHFPFSKGIDHWVNKHNVYSKMEAELIVNKKYNNFSFLKAFLSKDFNERRQNQKSFFYSLPFRPFLKFLYMMIIRRSFLDGREGLAYTLLQTYYEYLIVLKTKEIIRLKKLID